MSTLLIKFWIRAVLVAVLVTALAAAVTSAGAGASGKAQAGSSCAKPMKFIYTTQGASGATDKVRVTAGPNDLGTSTFVWHTRQHYVICSYVLQLLDRSKGRPDRANRFGGSYEEPVDKDGHRLLYKLTLKLRRPSA